MGEWYRVVKRIRGTPYVYMQRTHRVPGRRSPVTESYSLGRLDSAEPVRRRKPSLLQGLALATFGVEDEYGERYDSLWNRYVNKKVEPSKPMPPQPKTTEKPAAPKKEPADDAAGKFEAHVSSGEP